MINNETSPLPLVVRQCQAIMIIQQDDIKQQVGAMIREARKAKGLTQKELGDLLGIGESRVSKYEKGNQNPTLSTVQKIADALGITVQLSFK